MELLNGIKAISQDSARTDETCADQWNSYIITYNCRSGHGYKAVKLSVHNLLQNRTFGDPKQCCVRYIHLPANNMSWVEDLLKQYHKTSKMEHRQGVLLRKDFWKGQQHEAKSMPVHARFMRPRCNVVPNGQDFDTIESPVDNAPAFFEANGNPPVGSTGPENALTKKGDGIMTKKVMEAPKHRDFVLFLPYLHWETSENQMKMAKVIQNTKTGIKPDDKNLDRDSNLIYNHLLHDAPLHLRRTLDQSYYWNIQDTGTRDLDQVVFRGTKDLEKPQVIMVDQLWMWILDGHTVITSFPRRWGDNPNDESGIHRALRDKLVPSGDDENVKNIEEVYDLATLILDQCSKVFFETAHTNDRRPEMMDIFANAIGEVSRGTTSAYNTFWDLIKNEPGTTDSDDSSTAQDGEHNRQKKLLDINPEGNLSKEVKDIQDELKMIKRVFSDQQSVIEDYAKYLRTIDGQDTNIGLSTRNRANHLVDELKRRIKEVDELERAATHVADDLKELLALKQTQANLSEARDSVLQAQQANKLAEATADQNLALMLFTTVTIIFLPLGFVASCFGMNSKQFGQGDMNIATQFAYMLPLSSLIIITSFSLAFNATIRSLCAILMKIVWSWIIHYGRLNKVRGFLKKQEEYLEAYEKSFREGHAENRTDEEHARSKPESNGVSNGVPNGVPNGEQQHRSP